MNRVTFKDPSNPTTEELSAWLLNEIPKEQAESVMLGDCDIGYEFVGFVKTYWHLSKIIPKDYAVFDFGAAYNFQSWFFREHKRYVAIEPDKNIGMIQPNNCVIYRMDAKTYLDNCGDIPDNYKAFAIVNFVPSGVRAQDVRDLVKSKFKNVYTFYPS